MTARTIVSRLPAHDVKVPHVLGEDLGCALLVRLPRCDDGEPEVVGAIVARAVLVSLDTALDLDGAPDALDRMERSVKQHDFDADDARRGTTWSALCQVWP